MQKYVKPRRNPDGNFLVVRDPSDKTILPDVGAYVDWGGNAGRYWRRRVKCGDVSISKPPITTPTTSTKLKKKEV